MKSFSKADSAVIAVDLGATRLRAAVIHGDRVVSRSDGLTRATEGPEAVVERLLGHVRIALDEAAADGPPLPMRLHSWSPRLDRSTSTAGG